MSAYPKTKYIFAYPIVHKEEIVYRLKPPMKQFIEMSETEILELEAHYKEIRVLPEKGVIESVKEYVLDDSGGRQTFDSGAQRDNAESKGRPALIPALALRRLAILYEKGAKKYKDRNWEKGMPFSRVLDSLLRHVMAYEEGSELEDHLAAIAWNAFALMHYEEMIERGLLPETLNDLPNLRCNITESTNDKKEGVQGYTEHPILDGSLKPENSPIPLGSGHAETGKTPTPQPRYSDHDIPC